VVRKYQFQRQLARRFNFVVFSLHNHAVGDLGGTGPQEPRHPFHIHQAQPAGSIYFQVAAEAKGGDMNVVLFGQIQNGLVGLARQFPAVYINSQLTHGLLNSFTVSIFTQPTPH
jgi:hypothetical protein